MDGDLNFCTLHLVRDGLLLEQLYYRLNPIYCAAAVSPEHPRRD
jgi:hypothetical protein